MRCNSCGIETQTGNYCGKCGGTLVQSNCSDCGIELGNKNYCGSCGSKTVKVEPHQQLNNQKSKSGLVVGILMALLLIAAISLGIGINNVNESQVRAAASASASASAAVEQSQKERQAAVAKLKQDAAARKAAKEAAAAADAGTADGPANGVSSDTNASNSFPMVKVPLFVGMTEQQAISLALQMHLAMGSTTTTGNPDSACVALQTGPVVSQSIAPGTLVSTDTRLTNILITVDCSR